MSDLLFIFVVSGAVLGIWHLAHCTLFLLRLSQEYPNEVQRGVAKRGFLHILLNAPGLYSRSKRTLLPPSVSRPSTPKKGGVMRRIAFTRPVRPAVNAGEVLVENSPRPAPEPVEDSDETIMAPYDDGHRTRFMT